MIGVLSFSSEIKLSLFLSILGYSRSPFSRSKISNLLNSTSIISSARIFKTIYSASRNKPLAHPQCTLEQLVIFGMMKD